MRDRQLMTVDHVNGGLREGADVAPSSPHAGRSEFRVVVCGGGIAAIEGLLRLRRLLGSSVEIDVVAPNDELVMRPLAVRQPFASGPPDRYDLGRIVADNDANWVKDTLSWVDRDAQVVHTGGGESLHYDALLIAVGGRQVEAFDHVRTFRDAEADETYQGVVQDVEEGYSKSVAFLLPDGPVWPLPLYELALMTAERAYSMGIEDLEIALVTPEVSPMAIFGRTASDAVASLLQSAGISVYSSAQAKVPATGRVIVQPQGIELHPGRIIATPRVAGPGIRGLAGGSADGFIPIDSACRVPGADARVYAAGDAAAYPIKHGGLGAQMADTAAAAIAQLAGAEVEAKPFQPIIRAKLLSGNAPLYISARLVGPRGFESEVYDTPPWPEDEKVVAEELGPYLATVDALV
jgi:sulfide:quinone oxidoreductase